MRRLLALLAWVLLLLVPAAARADIYVTTSADAAGDGQCSIEEAVAAADAVSTPSSDCPGAVPSGTTVIRIHAGIYPVDSELELTSGASVAILGADTNDPSQTQLTANASRVLEVDSGASAELSGLTISGWARAGVNGHVGAPGAGGTSSSPNGEPGGFGGSGGAGEPGGGIFNSGSLSLSHVVLTGCRAGAGGDGGSGGEGGNGLSPSPLAYLYTAGTHGGDGGTGASGGPGGNGGAIYNEGSLSITDSAITDARAGAGGTGGRGGHGGDGGRGTAAAALGTTGGTGGGGGRGWLAGAGGKGGAIFNSGTATLRRVVISNVAAGAGGTGGEGGAGGHGGDGSAPGADTYGTGGAGGFGGYPALQAAVGGDGGAIYSSGSLSLDDVAISSATAGAGGHGGSAGNGGQGGQGGNYPSYTYGAGGDATNPGGPGGAGGLGGAVYVTGSFSMSASTVSASSAGAGGGGGEGGTGALSGSQGASTAGGPGGAGGVAGAIWFHGSSSLKPAQMSDVTLTGNAAGSGGAGGAGGLTWTGQYTSQPQPGGDGGPGAAVGGLLVDGPQVAPSRTGTPPAITLRSVTVADNKSGAGGQGGNGSPPGQDGSAGPGPGGIGHTSTSTTFAPVQEIDSLVANNLPVNCDGTVDGGHNLSYNAGFTDTSCAGINADPKLGTLQTDAATPTRPLLAGSAAIDAVPGTGASCETTDQRGVPRPQGTACDIGAFELGPPPVCQNGSVSTPYGRPVTVSLNCSSSTAPVLTYAVDASPSKGTLGAIDQQTGEVSYTPASGFSGNVTVKFHASTGDGSSASRTETVTVKPRPQPPVLSGTVPASPSNLDRPHVTGSAPSGTAVTLYASVDCSGSPAAIGSAADLGGGGISVTVAHNATTRLSATATDADGIVSVCSSPAISYVHDDVPPPVRIDAGPQGLTNNPLPTFAFSSTETDVTFACSLGIGTPAFGPCSGAGTDKPPSPLTDGSPVFRVRATDPAGNSTIATRAFTLDATPPDTVIDSGPAGTIPESAPRFSFHATEGRVTFECSLDQGPAAFRACSGPGASDASALALAAGQYTFRVRAIDVAGNADPTPATRSFTVSAPTPSSVDSVLVVVAVPTGRTATIPSLLASGGYTTTFDAPGAGTLTILWYQASAVGRAARSPVVLARGRLVTREAGKATLRVRLTPTGRRILKSSAHVALRARASFTSAGRPPAVVTRRFRLRG